MRRLVKTVPADLNVLAGRGVNETPTPKHARQSGPDACTGAKSPPMHASVLVEIATKGQEVQTLWLLLEPIYCMRWYVPMSQKRPLDEAQPKMATVDRRKVYRTTMGSFGNRALFKKTILPTPPPHLFQQPPRLRVGHATGHSRTLRAEPLTVSVV